MDRIGIDRTGIEQPGVVEPPDLEVVANPNHSAQRHQASFESLGRSALRHPVLVGLMAALGLVVGAAEGYEHPPTYTATVQLIVGRTSGLAEDEVPGLAQAVQGLASDYARLITSSDVVSDTEANLHSSSLPGTLSASPVAQSSIINVQANASSVAGAVSLANAGAAALVKVVTQASNDTQAQIQPVIAEYQRADAVFEQAEAQYNVLQTELNRLLGQIGNGPPSPSQLARENSLNARIAKAQTQADTARMQANAYANQYSAAVPPLTNQEQQIQQIGLATSATSDRTTYTEAGSLVGVVGGLVVGLAAASWLDARRSRRHAAKTD